MFKTKFFLLITKIKLALISFGGYGLKIYIAMFKKNAF